MKATYSSSIKKEDTGRFSFNLTLLMAVALIVGGLSIALGSLFSQRSPVGSAPIVQNAADILSKGDGTATGYADQLIAKNQALVAASPDDYKAYAELGLAFEQKARETNDPSFYTQAQDALNKSLAIKPDYYEAVAGLGTLNLSLHEFQKALDWGLKAQALVPTQAYAYGVVGDAQIELGRYDDAVRSFQKMVDIRPDLGSYSRVSYARELYGDMQGAIDAMQSAIRAGSPAAENTAWCRFQLGNIYFMMGNVDEAEKQFKEALQGYPGYLHAYAGLGQVAWARGDLAGAIDFYKQSVASVPLPQYLTALGDLYAISGDQAAADEQYSTVLYIFKVFEANGVNVDIEKAVFLADHKMDISSAVTLAERAAATRRDVNTLDGLAWTYYNAGRYADAKSAMEQAMRLGTQNALFFYHMGMIENALGDSASGSANLREAIEINPYFSILHSAEADRMVTK